MPQIHEQLIHPERIHPNPNNPRFEAGDVTELAKSIKRNGLLQALLVRPHPTIGGHFLLEDGSRRYAAMRHWATEIRCRVITLLPGQDPVETDLVVALTANTGKPLNAIERAKAYDRLRKERGMTATDIAERLGVTVPTVTRTLEMLDLAPRTQKAVLEGKLSVGDAHIIIRDHRKKQRKQKGKAPMGAPEWEEDSFNRYHPVAKRAELLCDSQEDHHAHRYGKSSGFRGACQRHWEQAIRLDEARIRRIDAEDAGLKVTFRSEGENGQVPEGSVVIK